MEMRIVLLCSLLFLYHPESGEADKVVSCIVVGDMIEADFGHGWKAEFPAHEYRCIKGKE